MDITVGIVAYQIASGGEDAVIDVAFGGTTIASGVTITSTDPAAGNKFSWDVTIAESINPATDSLFVSEFTKDLTITLTNPSGTDRNVVVTNIACARKYADDEFYEGFWYNSIEGTYKGDALVLRTRPADMVVTTDRGLQNQWKVRARTAPWFWESTQDDIYGYKTLGTASGDTTGDDYDDIRITSSSTTVPVRVQYLIWPQGLLEVNPPTVGLTNPV
jgi:hypothetical protein